MEIEFLVFRFGQPQKFGATRGFSLNQTVPHFTTTTRNSHLANRQTYPQRTVPSLKIYTIVL